ncbi:hypothetical protein [Sporisorium scitamineum]|uniref:Uncharacterized protein n=1 Tax=Sporisorium scitamineum TaxID=49012 RepID=A0A0F7S1P9_9BASI|nr:hypothetical protein [Sporisorium scitamineum]
MWDRVKSTFHTRASADPPVASSVSRAQNHVVFLAVSLSSPSSQT